MAFTWLDPKNWVRSRRHLSAYLVDTTNSKRRRWVAMQRKRDGSGAFILDRPLPATFSF